MLLVSARFTAGIFFHKKGCFGSSYCLVFTENFQCIPLALMPFAERITVYIYRAVPAGQRCLLHSVVRQQPRGRRLLPALFHTILKDLFPRNSELPFSTYHRSFVLLFFLSVKIGFGLIQSSVLKAISIF